MITIRHATPRRAPDRLHSRARPASRGADAPRPFQGLGGRRAIEAGSPPASAHSRTSADRPGSLERCRATAPADPLASGLVSHLRADDPLAVSLKDAIRLGEIDDLSDLAAARQGLAIVRILDAAGVSRTLLHIATDWPGNLPKVAGTIATLVAAGGDVHARIEGASPTGRRWPTRQPSGSGVPRKGSSSTGHSRTSARQPRSVCSTADPSRPGRFLC